MFRMQTANLTPEQRERLHPQFLANEQTYLKMRPALLEQHKKKWVAVGRGRLLASGENLLEVFEAAAKVDEYPYVPPLAKSKFSLTP